jgi:hypothetical protein
MSSRAYARAWLPASLLALALLSGCGYPAVQPMNQEIITSLRTACSAGDRAWLDANREKIEERRAAGEMEDREYKVFLAIIEQAESGDWKGAEHACLKFQQAQEPTAEQVAKIRAFHSK